MICQKGLTVVNVDLKMETACFSEILVSLKSHAGQLFMQSVGTGVEMTMTTVLTSQF